MSAPKPDGWCPGHGPVSAEQGDDLYCPTCYRHSGGLGADLALRQAAEVADLKARLKELRAKFLRHIEDTCDDSGQGPSRSYFEALTHRGINWRDWRGS